MKIPFSPPDIGDREIKEVINTLESGWITTGPRVKAFEKHIKDYVGADGCVCLNSQTACAEMTLRLLGIGPGDEVITTAYTYTATAAVIDHVGAKIILIDTVPNGYEMDYDSLEKAITEKTKAIIPVDLGGVPCNYKRLYSIVDEKQHLFKPANDIQAAFNRIIIISDSAHALGASYYHTMIGAVADFSNFSFHAVKNLTTAEGGAVTWKTIPGIDNDYIYTQYQLLSLHGQSKDALAKINGAWEYDVLGTYYKCNMTDISAAIGLKQLERYPSLLQRRKAIIEYYDNHFTQLDLLNHYNDTQISSGHLYLTRIPGISDQERNEIIQKMNLKGISCNVHYKPLPLLTAYQNLGFNIQNYPNAWNQFKNEITLPLYTTLSNEQIEYIVETYSTILNDYL